MKKKDLRLLLADMSSKFNVYFEKYMFEKDQNKRLMETNEGLYKRLQVLDEKIGLLMREIDEKENEIIVLKAIRMDQG